MKEQLIKDYYDSLSEEQKYAAFSAMIWLAYEGQDICYNDESGRFYWESNGEDIY